MKYDASLDIKILGGLPVTVRFETIAPNRSLGELCFSLGEWEIVSRSGKPLGDWIYKRIDETPGERQRIIYEIESYLDSAA